MPFGLAGSKSSSASSSASPGRGVITSEKVLSSFLRSRMRKVRMSVVRRAACSARPLDSRFFSSASAGLKPETSAPGLQNRFKGFREGEWMVRIFIGSVKNFRIILAGDHQRTTDIRRQPIGGRLDLALRAVRTLLRIGSKAAGHYEDCAQQDSS